MKMVRLGLIGAGPWGLVYIKTIRRLKNAALLRVASRNPETRRVVGPACEVSADWREVARAKNLDGLIIATPPALHAEMAREAIEAGLPVLVEKPLTTDLPQALGLRELAERRQVHVRVDHIQLHNPAYDALKRLCREKGPIRSIHSFGGNRGPFRPDTPPLWDYGPHDVSLCLDLLGTKPASVAAAREESRRTPEGPGENIRIALEFPDGVSADIFIGNLMKEKRRRLEVRLAREALVMDDSGPHKLALHALEGRELGPAQGVAVARDLPLRRAVLAFIAAIESGSKDLSSLRLGVDVVEVLSKCESALGPY